MYFNFEVCNRKHIALNNKMLAAIKTKLGAI